MTAFGCVTSNQQIADTNKRLIPLRRSFTLNEKPYLLMMGTSIFTMDAMIILIATIAAAYVVFHFVF